MQTTLIASFLSSEISQNRPPLFYILSALYPNFPQNSPLRSKQSISVVPQSSKILYQSSPKPTRSGVPQKDPTLGTNFLKYTFLILRQELKQKPWRNKLAWSKALVCYLSHTAQPCLPRFAINNSGIGLITLISHQEKDSQICLWVNDVFIDEVLQLSVTLLRYI